MVILNKNLKPRSVRFLQAAELIGGPGHGWATRFVAVVKEAGTPSPGSDLPEPFPKISVSRIHNILSGHREVTPALEAVIVRLADASALRMEANAAWLRKLSLEMVTDLEDSSPR